MTIESRDIIVNFGDLTKVFNLLKEKAENEDVREACNYMAELMGTFDQGDEVGRVHAWEGPRPKIMPIGDFSHSQPSGLCDDTKSFSA